MLVCSTSPMTLVRNAFEGAVGVGLSLLISLAVLPLSLFGLGYFGLFLFPVVALLANWSVGLIQIKRSFKIMGWAIIGTGIASSVVFPLLF